jgi:BASS family bile acid:Na+ symporter
MIPEILQVITQVAIVVFIVGSMAAMGLGLTIPRIVEPLRDLRLVAGLLVVNFIVVPAAAIAAGRLLPMEPPAASAVILIGCAAGAPFLPKLAQLARGDVALAVGGMVLLMVVTVFYAPIVVPLAVPGATVDAGQIARSLIVLMLVPLGIGLAVRARYPGLADDWVGPAGQASSAGLLIGISAAVLLTWQDILGAALVLVAGLLAGWLVGWNRPEDRRLLGLATAQRNIAAALVVASTLGGDTLLYTLVGALVIPIVLIVLAGEMGRRRVVSAAARPPPAQRG